MAHRGSRVYLGILILMLLLAFVNSECPNGCSGNGDCMARDMCNCYKNYQGNDCSDRTCGFGYAHVDTPKGDINFDQNRMTTGWILQNSHQAPAKTYEYFYPNAKVDEAHFYLECSNKGICDRSTGLCKCFDGFEGSACQRTSCPNKCNGHGTCESLRELGIKAGGTLFGKGTIAGAVSYDLWDANSTYGCLCDPGFFGPDCSKRSCKVGIDPLYLGTYTAILETFFVHAYLDSSITTFPSGAWIRLLVFDYSGDSYITSKIPIVDEAVGAANQAANAAAFVTALKNVPNLSFANVICESQGVGSFLAGFKSLRAGSSVTLGASVVCQYIDNPGKSRLPKVYDYSFGTVSPNLQFVKVVTTTQQGSNHDWFTSKSTAVVSSITSGTAVTLSTDPGAGTTALFPQSGMFLIKLGANIVTVSAIGSATTFTLQYPLTQPLSSSDKIIFLEPTATLIVTEITTPLLAVAVGDTEFTYDITTNTDPNLSKGDRLFYMNQFFWVRGKYVTTVTPGSGSPYDVAHYTLDSPFGGNSDTGDSGAAGTKVLKVTEPTTKTGTYTYVSECSGRGLCTYDTGICACFKGYTNDNCNTQNVLAM